MKGAWFVGSRGFFNRLTQPRRKNGFWAFLIFLFIGVLNPVHKNHPLNLEAFNFLKKFDSLASLRGFLNTDPRKFEEIYSLLSARDVFNYSAQTF